MVALQMSPQFDIMEAMQSFFEEHSVEEVEEVCEKSGQLERNRRKDNISQRRLGIICGKLHNAQGKSGGYERKNNRDGFLLRRKASGGKRFA